MQGDERGRQGGEAKRTRLMVIKDDQLLRLLHHAPGRRQRVGKIHDEDILSGDIWRLIACRVSERLPRRRVRSAWLAEMNVGGFCCENVSGALGRDSNTNL